MVRPAGRRLKSAVMRVQSGPRCGSWFMLATVLHSLVILTPIPQLYSSEIWVPAQITAASVHCQEVAGPLLPSAQAELKPRQTGGGPAWPDRGSICMDGRISIPSRQKNDTKIDGAHWLD